MQQKPKRQTMREREQDARVPFWVAGEDATPSSLGERDDVAWAIARRFETFLYDQGIPSGKNAAWLFKRGQDALDKSCVRKAYSEHRERFRNGDGKTMTLAEFGAKMVRYFEDHASWYECSNADDVIGMFYDPVVLDDCAKGLWRVYRDRRARRGIK
jgi:hypothetical protein